MNPAWVFQNSQSTMIYCNCMTISPKNISSGEFISTAQEKEYCQCFLQRFNLRLIFIHPFCKLRLLMIEYFKQLIHMLMGIEFNNKITMLQRQFVEKLDRKLKSQDYMILCQQNKELSKLNSTYIAKIDLLSYQIQQKDSIINSLSNGKDQIVSKYNEVKTKYQHYQIVKNSLQHDFNALKLKLQQSQTHLNQKVSHLTEELSAKNNEINNMLQEMEITLKTNTKLQKVNIVLKQQNIKLKQQLSQLSIQNIDHKMQMLSKMGSWATLQKQHEGVKRTVYELEKELGGRQKQKVRKGKKPN